MYTAARLLLSKVVNKTEKEICKEICKQGCENWDQCKEFVQNTKIYENMVNRLHSLEGRMYNGYQKFKNTPVGCAVNNSLCRVISEVDDVIQLVNKRNTVEQMSTPQVRVLPIHPAIQQATERLLTLSSCSTSKQTPSTSSSERSSTINDASTDTSSLSSPQKQFPDQKTGGKSQGIGE